MRVFLLTALLLPFSYAQYGLFGGGFGGGMPPYMPDPYMGSQFYGYGNPMMGGLGGSSGMLGGPACTDLSPQCSVWASTGQCATNPMMMRQTCALSCGTCATGLGSASFYNPFGSLGIPSTGLGQYPLSQFIGRSIYETGILRQPSSPTYSKESYRTKSASQSASYLPQR